MDLKKIVESKSFKNTLLIIGGVVIVLLIFQAGVFVGYHKAAFSYRAGERFYRAYDDQTRNFMGTPRIDNYSNPHGTVGKIVEIDLPSIVIEDGSNIEKVVNLDDDTVIKGFRGSSKADVLKIGDLVLILGSPIDDREIQAKLIRLLPTPKFQLNANGYATSSIIK